ncbi:hypothetical protein D3C72_1309810 [compost metagenome]
MVSRFADQADDRLYRLFTDEGRQDQPADGSGDEQEGRRPAGLENVFQAGPEADDGQRLEAAAHQIRQ